MGAYICGNARFSVITNGVIRIEYSDSGKFIDDETLFAKRNSFFVSDVSFGDTELIVKTEKITLKYQIGNHFAPDTLCAEIHCGDFISKWHFGDKNKQNLGGTLTTMDGVDGFRPLPDGILARDGWYVHDDSHTPILVNGWAKNRDDSHVYDLYLFAYGADYKAALRDLAAVSGKMEMPRKYFLGSWYSRWWPYTADDFKQIVREYDENEFPLDILVMDMDWHYQDWSYQEGDPRPNFGYGHAGQNLGWTGYTWNKRYIPDHYSLISELGEKGIAVTLNDHPADGVRDHEDIYPAFKEILDNAGYVECVPDVIDMISDREKNAPELKPINYRFNAGNKTYMDAFFDATRKNMEDVGCAFRWLDWQQDHLYPEVHGIKGLTHLNWLNYLYYHNSEIGGKRGMSFSRWGGIGDHKHPAYFSGDSASTWECLEFEIQMTVSAGNAGCFWWSHDIGGFMDPVPGGQAELYVRWVQFGALSAALRVHMCGTEGLDRRPWTWGEPYCDAMRKMFQLRSCIMPYIYSAAYQSREYSIPLLRPLYLDMPCIEEAYKHPSAYMFGDGLLVYPVCKLSDETGIVKSEVWLPEGTWYDWFSGEKYEAGYHIVENGLDTLPLFVRAGYPIVTQQYTSRMATASLNAPIVKIFGFGEAETTLYEDDGVSLVDSENCRISNIKTSVADGEYRIAVRSTGYGFFGEVETRDYIFEICDVDMITAVNCETHDTDCTWDPSARKYVITVKSVKSGDSFELILC